MSQSYNPTLPTQRDQLRHRLADTDQLPLTNTGAGKTAMVLQDEEIDALIANHGYEEASALCAETMGAYYARLADDVDDADTNTKFKDRSKWYFEVADRIRTNLGTQLPSVPAVGKITEPDLSEYRTD